MEIPEFRDDHEFEAVCLTAEEVKVVDQWLGLAIYEGGGCYGDDFRAWFPVIKKLFPPSCFKEISYMIRSERDRAMAQEFLEYVDLVD